LDDDPVCTHFIDGGDEYCSGVPECLLHPVRFLLNEEDTEAGANTHDEQTDKDREFCS
jgi:hypothetical protein